MEDILPGITKFIVSPQTGGNLLQFLPLTGESPFPTGQTVPPVSQRQSGEGE